MESAVRGRQEQIGGTDHTRDVALEIWHQILGMSTKCHAGFVK